MGRSALDGVPVRGHAPGNRKERREARVEEGAAVESLGQAAARGRASRSRLVRITVVPAFVAAVALVILPTGAAADHRVPPPACPSGAFLQGIERAPGGVIFGGTVVTREPDIWHLQVAVASWFHRSPVPGLAPGELPATMDVLLGPRGSLAGRAATAALPPVGTRLIVAGTWAGGLADVTVACGVLADMATPVGAAWLAQASSHYAAAPPSTDRPPQRLPLDAPWFQLSAGAAFLLVVAMVLGALAQAWDPAPAV